MNTLIQNTQFTGKNLIHLERVDSTNNYAKELITNSTPKHGTVILADEQYAGRGQSGNIWQSEAGKNLTFSIIYDTSFLRAEYQFYLNMAVSLGVCEAIDTLLTQKKTKSKSENEVAHVGDESKITTIKWPNDIYIGNKKVAGLLIENFIQGQNLKHSVIGIGINVNQINFGELKVATSLVLEVHELLNRLLLLQDSLVAIERNLLKINEDQFADFTQKYLERLYLLNTESHFINAQHIVFSGKITNITKEGKLEIESEGRRLFFGFKEVSFVR